MFNVEYLIHEIIESQLGITFMGGDEGCGRIIFYKSQIWSVIVDIALDI